jgi:hypothetical protein
MDDERYEQLKPAERAFVLRLWPAGADGDQGRGQWRIVLQDVDSQRRRGFARLDEFIAYMEGLWTESA